MSTRNLTVRVDPMVLRRALRNALLFASKDDARPILTGVLFESSAAGVDVVATDSYRMVRMTLPTVDADGEPVTVPSSGPAGRWLLPRHAADLWARALPARHWDRRPTALRLGARSATLTVPESGEVFRTRLVDGDFPAWRTLWDSAVGGKPPSHVRDIPADWSEFALDPDLLGGVMKVVPLDGRKEVPVRFARPSHPLVPIRMSWVGSEGGPALVEAMIMPVRIGGYDR